MNPAAAAVLTLDAALAGCGAGVVRGTVVLAEQMRAGGRGSGAALPEMAAAVLREAGVATQMLARVAVTVGPGSFTGVRAALALAHGIGLGAGADVVGVGVGDAIRLVNEPGAWVAVDSARGRVFLDRGAGFTSVDPVASPWSEWVVPGRPVSVAGDAAEAVAESLRRAGYAVHVLREGLSAAGIAAAAALHPCPAVPLYVDGVAARVQPALRPAPFG